MRRGKHNVRLTAIEAIRRERRRQITAEGFTPEHDDKYVFGQLARAAGCYALQASGMFTAPPAVPPKWWPWSITWWKSSTRRRDLVKAAALIVAEIERLDRAGGDNE